jgi:thiamine biosynthesis protein ThiS
MHLTINGDLKDFEDGLTLAALVEQLGMRSDRLAIELNGSIVSRAHWADTTLKEADRLEIVHFVGGGSGR